MKLKQYQIDAFTDKLFSGNPAAVLPLDAWPADSLLQAIAAENNLSETAFFVPTGNGFHLRWFTPVEEVDLCGHATLATAFVLFERLGYAGPVLTFQTRSGDLFVEKRDGRFQLNLPAAPPVPGEIPPLLVEGLGRRPLHLLVAGEYMAVFAEETAVRSLTPDYARLAQLDLSGVIVTAPGDDPDVDFVSRFFAPKIGIPEDPVTGSAHAILAPYWADRLGKNPLYARQISPRGGEMICEVKGDRVLLLGAAVLFMEGEIVIP
jgi:PhzF family phenazine biosynthesis protein